MSKPKDPVIAVLTYFETTDLALARQTLAIVGQIIKRRTPQLAKARATSRGKTGPSPAPAAVPASDSGPIAG